MGRIAFDFLWIFIVTSILLGLLATVIPSLSTTGTAVGTLTGAIMSGQRHGRRSGGEASRSFSWKVALVLTLITLIVTAILVGVVRQSAGFDDLGEISPSSYALGVAVMGALVLFLVRFFFRWGTKMGAKSLDGSTG